tara:strand:- start:1212 stop:2114 length:903 start_codon:yes stop_codon:yes gene_type:complete
MGKNGSTELRELLNSKPLLQIGGGFDALSAKLIELNGFDAVWASSFAISASYAVPDASIMTMTEFLNVTTSMVETCSLPIIADCDTGFGGPSNVSHLVKKYESAGVAAICIEDKIFPKKNSLLEETEQELLPEKDFVAKIIAGKEAKMNNDFMVIARTEALIANQGIDEAIKRANAYEKAGADAILIHSKKDTPSEIFGFTEKWKGNIPLVVVPTSYTNVTKKELIEHQIKMVIFANQSLRASYVAMSKVLKEIINCERLSEVTTEQISMKEIFNIQKMYKIESQEKEIEDKLKKLGYIN